MADLSLAEPEFEARMKALARQVVWVRRVAAFLFVAGLFVASWGMAKFSQSGTDLANLGSFLEGGAGSLWSLAGLALIYLAFLGQQQQVLQQAEELAATRKEMQEQTATFEAQRFDSSFFSLLDAHEEFVRDLSSPKLDSGVKGREVFRRLRVQMAQQFERMVVKRRDETLNMGMQIYDQWYSENEAMLGPYFRSLYQIARFVDDRRPPTREQDERKRYLNFLRARLSSDELVLLFYNLVSERGAKFRLYADRYAILKHLPQDRLFRSAHAEEARVVLSGGTQVA